MNGVNVGRQQDCINPARLGEARAAHTIEDLYEAAGVAV
jgi:hypothetical protein